MMTGREKELIKDFLKWVWMVFLILGSIVVFARLLRSEPIGIDNSNPGNIRSHNLKYWRSHGAVSLDPWKHLVFATDMDGLRTMAFVLRAYDRKGFRTIRRITSRWVGPKNSKAAQKSRLGYMRKLEQDVGAGPDEQLDMGDSFTIAVLVKALVYAENGVDPYSWNQYLEACRER